MKFIQPLCPCIYIYVFHCGVIETEKNLSTPQRLLEIERDMVELMQQFQPDWVAIEMPYFNRQIKAAGGVMQALGVINLVIYREILRTSQPD